MKRLVVLGAGTAGTTVANQLRTRIPSDWSLTVVDPQHQHLFQPDLIFLPFGMQAPERMERPRQGTLGRGVDWLQREVLEIDPDGRQLILDNDDHLDYDLLVIATGSHIHPEETPGTMGEHWHQSIFDYYTLEGALALREALQSFEGGKIAINIVEMPIKCPVAPLEFAFLAEAYFTQRGLRDQVELHYVTPLDGAFTKPVASKVLGSMLEDRGIQVEAEFNTAEVDGDRRVLRSYDEREVPYDLLVTIPTHMGAQCIEKSGLGDELAFIPTDKHTLQAENHDDIFVLGDATNLQTSKAGSVAHFQAEVVVENVLRAIAGHSLEAAFDGHANCFIESGYGNAMLIDFNYDVEPLPGVYPLPVIGPMTLLKESHRNHWGKLAFRWVYWNMLLPGRPIPVTNRLSMVGKKRPSELPIATEKELAA
jgi:sulfide:quinone oxidoreductase